jgi:hypothetical protein
MKHLPLVVGRGLAVLVVIAALAGCGSSAHKSAEAPRPLAVQANGIIDPTRVNLSGAVGVTPDEQHRAEQLLQSTIVHLQRWTDVARALADGFVSIHDGFTGSEHFVHWDWIEDGDVLDPAHPESLVYRVKPDGRRVLEAAMYILPKRFTLSNVPDVGGRLTQFHIHSLFCFDTSATPRFFRLARPDGACIPPLVKRLTTPMVHVWIRPNPCGPFAAIGGFASGTVSNGEEIACDREHGSAFRA